MDRVQRCIQKQSEESQIETGKVVANIALEIGNLGIEVTDIAGHVDALTERVANQVAAFAELNRAAEAMIESKETVASAAERTRATTAEAQEGFSESRTRIDGAVGNIRELVGIVTSLETRLTGLNDALNKVSNVAGNIDAIAKQTNLLALNATIEAARAGEAGRGFSVVAGEVKELAGQTSAATQEIDVTLRELTDQTRSIMRDINSGIETADTVRQGADAMGGIVESIGTAMQQVDDQASEIFVSARDIGENCEIVGERIGVVAEEAELSSRNLRDASERLNSMTGVSEKLIILASSAGAETVDTPYIRCAQDAAERISEIFEEALRTGEVSISELFDESYEPIADTDPQQLMAAFTSLTDRTLPAIQEPILAADSKILFCAALDRNGYLPTHNEKFSQPQGDDPAWNAANSRNRRIFDDRVGLAAGRNTKPFLLQLYRRDMGGGKFVMMKDLSAPIRVSGRHWGGFRIGYSI